MKLTSQSRRAATQLFRMCIVDGALDGSRVRRVLQTLLDSKRRGYMTVVSYFGRLVRLHCAQHTAEVQSAVPLSAEVKFRISAELERVYGSGLQMRFKDVPELIGGIRVAVGSDVFDGSVQYRLALLSKGFSIAGTSENRRPTSSADRNGVNDG